MDNSLAAEAQQDVLMDELNEVEVPSVGERLRVAREEKGISLEEIASQTRIPRRHLESIEEGEWSRLPAPTYTIGFARSYASTVGLDRNEIGDQLRAEMGRQRPDSTSSEVFEPADPARTMPKWLVLGAIAAIILVVAVMSWLNNRSLQQPEEPASQQSAAAEPVPTVTPAPGASTPMAGPVVLSATAPVWIQVTDGGSSLFEGELAAGQNFQVPETATAPVLKAGKPEALRVSVGGTVVPPVGPAGQVVSNVSLAPADLMRGGNAAAAPASGAPVSQ